MITRFLLQSSSVPQLLHDKSDDEIRRDPLERRLKLRWGGFRLRGATQKRCDIELKSHRNNH